MVLAICTACIIRACMLNSSSILVDSKKTPWTILTGWEINYQHLTSSFFGALATVPRVGKDVGVLPTRNELCVAICPVFNGSNAHIVLLHGHRNPSIRGGLQLVQEESVILREPELQSLEPEHDKDGMLIKFKAPSETDFSLEDKVTTPSPSAPNIETSGIDKGVENWLHPIKTGSMRSSPQTSATIPITNEQSEIMRGTENLFPPMEPDSPNIPSHIKDNASTDDNPPLILRIPARFNKPSTSSSSSTHSSSHITDPSTLMPMSNALELCWDIDLRVFTATYLLEHNKLPTEDALHVNSLMYAVYGASALLDPYTSTNNFTFFTAKPKPPKYPKVRRDPTLREEWRPTVRKEVDGLINKEKLIPLSEEEFIERNFKLLPHCIPLRVKRDGTKKGRFTICGNFESPSIFPPGSCFSPTLGEDPTKYIIAFAVYHRMFLNKADQTQAFCNNEWKNSACPRNIAVILDPFASGTGKEELMDVASKQFFVSNRY